MSLLYVDSQVVQIAKTCHPGLARYSRVFACRQVSPGGMSMQSLEIALQTADLPMQMLENAAEQGTRPGMDAAGLHAHAITHGHSIQP